MIVVLAGLLTFSILMISACATAPCADCETELVKCKLENNSELVNPDEPECYEEKKK